MPLHRRPASSWLRTVQPAVLQPAILLLALLCTAAPQTSADQGPIMQMTVTNSPPSPVPATPGQGVSR